MSIVRQTKDNTCVACVLAMMIDESEQYVLDWFEHIDPPHSDTDAFIFLAHHGIFLSLELNCKNKSGKGVDLSNIDYLATEIEIVDRSAYLVVDSPTKVDGTHAVFWNGKYVLDPLKDTPQELSDYKVRKLYPMTVTEERYTIHNLRK